MLILGGRYGSIEPLSGNSYTEVEYDYATEIKKPLFAVVISDDYLCKKGKDFIEKDNVSKLDAFRKKVLSNISSFFNSPNDIKLAIHESITDFKEKYNFIGWIPGNSEGKNTQLYEENLKLQKKIAELEREATQTTSNFNVPDLAEMTDFYSFTCPCQTQSGGKSAALIYTKISFSFTWNDLFAAIAPSLLDNQEDVAAVIALKSLCKKTHPDIHELDISKNILQTIKIQFMANDLIDSSGYSWDLTDKGRKGLIMLKAIKKKVQ